MSASPESFSEFDAPGQEGRGFAKQYEAVKRRFWPMLATFLVILAATVAAALLWPATYRSTGTILIEQQEIPSEFIRSAVSSYADERVQVISQRVMTVSNLSSIIEKHNLYAGEREDLTREQLIEQMRNDVKLDMISAEVVDPRMGRATQATIAFAVGFENRSPQLAARVANDLVTLYMQKNIESRKQLAEGTSQFLAEETERLRRSVAELERRLSDFKEKNYGQLPEFSQMNVTMAAQARQELRDVDARIQAFEQQIGFLNTQIAQTDPRTPAMAEDGRAILGSAERLRGMREQYIGLLAQYTPRHPTVANLKRDIYGLELQVGGGGAATAVLESLEEATGQLAAARRAEPQDAADVQRLEARVGEIAAQLKSMPLRGPTADSAAGAADNPVYLQLRAQQQASISERASLAGRRGDLYARIAELEQKQAMTPVVERDYTAMLRELQGEQAKFSEVRQKQMEAQLALNLESEQKGERFTLIEPPMVPQEPVSPNRPAIFLLGFVLSLGAPVGLMLLLEMIDTRIRGRREVVDLVGMPPLAIIPWVEDLRQTGRWSRWRRQPSAA